MRRAARLLLYAGAVAVVLGLGKYHASNIGHYDFTNSFRFAWSIAYIVILCLAVIGIYAGKGPAWAVSTEWLSAGTAAAGFAQINAISNLAGFGTTYVMGFIKDATGSFSLALVPLVALAATGAWAIVWIGDESTLVALREDKAGPNI